MAPNVSLLLAVLLFLMTGVKSSVLFWCSVISQKQGDLRRSFRGTIV